MEKLILRRGISYFVNNVHAQEVSPSGTR